MKEKEIGFFDFDGIAKEIKTDPLMNNDDTGDDLATLVRAITRNSQEIAVRTGSHEIKFLGRTPDLFNLIEFQEDFIVVNGKSYSYEHGIASIILVLIRSHAIKINDFCAMCVIDHYCRLRQDPNAPGQIPPRAINANNS